MTRHTHRNNVILENRYDFNERHLKNLSDLIYQAAENHSKILPIRIDFHLSSSYTIIEREHFVDYWQTMQNKMRRNSLFDHFITYVAKLEYGNNRGWHMHLLMLFDGQYHQHDYHLASQIGEYWVKTIKDSGSDQDIDGNYYACNMAKKRYDHCALKNINCTYALNDSSKNRNAKTDLDLLIDATAYLTKIHQGTLDHFEELGLTRHPRTMFFGRVKPKSKRGRPRNSNTSSK